MKYKIASDVSIFKLCWVFRSLCLRTCRVSWELLRNIICVSHANQFLIIFQTKLELVYIWISRLNLSIQQFLRSLRETGTNRHRPFFTGTVPAPTYWDRHRTFGSGIDRHRPFGTGTELFWPAQTFFTEISFKIVLNLIIRSWKTPDCL